MKKYEVNQKVKVIVEKILPFGIYVRLDDGSNGYIRRRELDLDADVDPLQVVKENDSIEAVILNSSEPGKYIELSRRATLESMGKTNAGYSMSVMLSKEMFPRSTLMGFTSVFNLGSMVLYLFHELASKTVGKPEDVLWVGDDIEAIITQIVESKKYISLSINRLKQYDHAFQVSGDFVMESSTEGETVHSIQTSDKTIDKNQGIDYQKACPILIVEDDNVIKKPWQNGCHKKGFRYLLLHLLKKLKGPLNPSSDFIDRLVFAG